jgi:uncharacterized protein
MKVVDVNILILAVQKDAPEHPRVLNWWESNLAGDEEIGLAWTTVLGFVRISTNSKLFASPLSVAEAVAFVDKWLEHPNVRVVFEAEDHWSRVSSLLKHTGAAGNLTTDAHLAAIAMAGDAAVASCDADFAKFPGLRWENPLTD